MKNAAVLCCIGIILGSVPACSWWTPPSTALVPARGTPKEVADSAPPGEIPTPEKGPPEPLAQWLAAHPEVEALAIAKHGSDGRYELGVALQSKTEGLTVCLLRWELGGDEASATEPPTKGLDPEALEVPCSRAAESKLLPVDPRITTTGDETRFAVVVGDEEARRWRSYAFGSGEAREEPFTGEVLESTPPAVGDPLVSPPPWSRSTSPPPNDPEVEEPEATTADEPGATVTLERVDEPEWVRGLRAEPRLSTRLLWSSDEATVLALSRGRSQTVLLYRRDGRWHRSGPIEREVLGAMPSDALRPGTLSVTTTEVERGEPPQQQQRPASKRVYYDVFRAAGEQLTLIDRVLLGEQGFAPGDEQGRIWRVFHQVHLFGEDTMVVSLDHAWSAPIDPSTGALGPQELLIFDPGEPADELAQRYGRTPGRRWLRVEEPTQEEAEPPAEPSESILCESVRCRRARVRRTNPRLTAASEQRLIFSSAGQLSSTRWPECECARASGEPRRLRCQFILCQTVSAETGESGASRQVRCSCGEPPGDFPLRAHVVRTPGSEGAEDSAELPVVVREPMSGGGFLLNRRRALIRLGLGFPYFPVVDLAIRLHPIVELDLGFRLAALVPGGYGGLAFRLYRSDESRHGLSLRIHGGVLWSRNRGADSMIGGNGPFGEALFAYTFHRSRHSFDLRTGLRLSYIRSEDENEHYSESTVFPGYDGGLLATMILELGYTYRITPNFGFFLAGGVSYHVNAETLPVLPIYRAGVNVDFGGLRR